MATAIKIGLPADKAKLHDRKLSLAAAGDRSRGKSIEAIGSTSSEIHRPSDDGLHTVKLDRQTQFGLRNLRHGSLDVPARGALKSFGEADHDDRQAAIAEAEKERTHDEHEVRCLKEKSHLSNVLCGGMPSK